MDINDALKCADDPEMNSGVETTLAAEVRRLSAELERLREQKPVRWYVRGNYFHDGDAAILFASMNAVHGAKVEQLYAAPVSAPHKGATHCDDCGLTWLDDGLNPLGCPYCKQAPDSDTVRNTGRKFSDEDLAEIHQLAYQLGGTDNGEYQLDGDELEQVVVKCAFLFFSNSAPDTVLDAEVGAAIQKAAASLPDGYTVVITVEAGAATVELCDGSGNTSVMDVDNDNRLAAEIVAAIDAARGAK